MYAQIHHISILNRLIKPTFDFYHNTLGLKLLMKTINQDDHTMYHLFFSDNEQRTGTELTFFELNDGQDQSFGTNTIERTILKVPTRASLDFWSERLEQAGICHYGVETFNQHPILRFEAPDNTQMALVPLREFENAEDYFPAEHSEIPVEHAILGIDAIQLRVQYAAATKQPLVDYLHWHEKETVPFFETAHEVTVLENHHPQFYQEVHIIDDRTNPLAIEGIGGVHHVAFGVEDTQELTQVDSLLDEKNFTNSGIKDREFFKSLYFREPNHLLFEIATQKGLLDAEAYENQSSNFDEIPLYLPHFLADQRERIEAILAQQRHE